MIKVREDDVSTAGDEKAKHAAYADDLGGAETLGVCERGGIKLFTLVLSWDTIRKPRSLG